MCDHKFHDHYGIIYLEELSLPVLYYPIQDPSSSTQRKIETWFLPTLRLLLPNNVTSQLLLFTAKSKAFKNNFAMAALSQQLFYIILYYHTATKKIEHF